MTVNLHLALVERAPEEGVDSLPFPTTLGILAGVSPATPPALALLLLVDMAKVSGHTKKD